MRSIQMWMRILAKQRHGTHRSRHFQTIKALEHAIGFLIDTRRTWCERRDLIGGQLSPLNAYASFTGCMA